MVLGVQSSLQRMFNYSVHNSRILTCQCCHRYQIAVHATYCCTAVAVNKVKLWNQQHVLFCSFAIKETNFVLILVAHLQFSEVAAATTNMTDLSRHEYDWRLRQRHINTTHDSDLTTASPPIGWLPNYTAWLKSHMCVSNLPRVALDSGKSRIRTRNLLIASPA